MWSEALRRDSGITEGSVTQGCLNKSFGWGNLEAVPTSLHSTCKVLAWKGDTMVAKTGVMRKAVIYDYGL